MGYNGEILTYYRELYNYTLGDIANILDTELTTVNEMEEGVCQDKDLIKRYCRILQINPIMFFIEYKWIKPEKRREFTLWGENGRYYVFCVKDDLKIEFEVSKVDILEIVTDIIWTMAGDNYNFDMEKVL